MIEEIHLSIPDLHPSLNQWARLWHYQKVNKEKIRWNTMIFYASRKMPKMTGRVKVRIIYYFPTKRNRDIDNYAPKFILDGLVESSIIEDDHSGIVEDLSVRIDYDKKNPRTEIVITKV